MDVHGRSGPRPSRGFWGPDFQFDDFFPLFTADRYDPEAMVQFLHDCGVRYIVPMCKHHDGVAWWDSAWTKRNFAQLDESETC